MFRKSLLVYTLLCTQVLYSCIKCDDLTCAKRSCAVAAFGCAAGGFGAYLMPATIGKWLTGLGFGLCTPSAANAAYYCCRRPQSNREITIQPIDQTIIEAHQRQYQRIQ